MQICVYFIWTLSLDISMDIHFQVLAFVRSTKRHYFSSWVDVNFFSMNWIFKIWRPHVQNMYFLTELDQLLHWVSLSESCFSPFRNLGGPFLFIVYLYSACHLMIWGQVANTRIMFDWRQMRRLNNQDKNSCKGLETDWYGPSELSWTWRVVGEVINLVAGPLSICLSSRQKSWVIWLTTW